VLTVPVSYERLVQRSFEKIRQSGAGMPAVLIRQLDAIAEIMSETSTPEQRQVLLAQAEMIERVNIDSVPEPSDRDDVHRRYEAVLLLNARLDAATA
jgi:uncharacterized membrane protein